MRQTLADFEEAFVEEAHEDRERREMLLRQARARSRQRQAERVRRSGTLRFFLLSLALVLTAVVVTIVMFRTLYVVMG